MVHDIDELLPEVLTYAPKCPEPLAFRFIREAAVEVCTRGKVWRESDEIEVDEPEGEILCTLPDASIIEIEWAALDSQELTPKTLAWLDCNVRGWQTSTETAPPRYITQLELNTVMIVPRATGTLKLRLVLKPSRTALTLPSTLIEHYGTDIGKGAAGRILTTPNAEWANPQLGAALVAEFQSRLDSLAVTAAKGQQGAPLRTKGRYF